MLSAFVTALLASLEVPNLVRCTPSVIRSRGPMLCLMVDTKGVSAYLLFMLALTKSMSVWYSSLSPRSTILLKIILDLGNLARHLVVVVVSIVDNISSTVLVDLMSLVPTWITMAFGDSFLSSNSFWMSSRW